MTWDNGGIRSCFDPPVDTAMLRLRRVISRICRPAPVKPWEWERLATPEEITRLRQTDLRRAA